jgi:hypothetical protein
LLCHRGVPPILTHYIREESIDQQRGLIGDNREQVVLELGGKRGV